MEAATTPKTKSLFVSVLGTPNVGKSSLINAMVNSKVSIVSSKPQTTRNKIRGILTIDDSQIVFIDTPGLHNPKTHLGDYMISEIYSSFSGTDACIHVIDATKNITEYDKKLIKKFENLKTPVILAINKIDLLKDKTKLIEIMSEYSKLYNYNAIVPISAKTKNGKNDLMEELLKLTKPSVFFFSEDDITDQTERTLVCEIIREKLLWYLDKELPHGIAVVVERFFQKNENFANIEATIYCERENHKSIIIGKNGQMIKKVGTSARLELEKILSEKINLNLWVKVKENWRNKDSILHNLGYIKENI